MFRPLRTYINFENDCYRDDLSTDKIMTGLMNWLLKKRKTRRCYPGIKTVDSYLGVLIAINLIIVVCGYVQSCMCLHLLPVIFPGKTGKVSCLRGDTKDLLLNFFLVLSFSTLFLFTEQHAYSLCLPLFPSLSLSTTPFQPVSSCRCEGGLRWWLPQPPLSLSLNFLTDSVKMLWSSWSVAVCQHDSILWSCL